jgi:hypothetical protein
MTVRVNLPPGCNGLNLQDGTRYTGHNGHVDVAEHHAAAVERLSTGGDAGLVSARPRSYLGTKKGRRCEPCRRLWNAWSYVCPRCGVITAPEAEA